MTITSKGKVVFCLIKDSRQAGSVFSSLKVGIITEISTILFLFFSQQGFNIFPYFVFALRTKIPVDRPVKSLDKLHLRLPTQQFFSQIVISYPVVRPRRHLRSGNNLSLVPRIS